MLRHILFFPLLMVFSLSTVSAQEITLEEALIQYEDELNQSVHIALDIPENEVKSGFNEFVKDNFNTDLKGYGLLSRKDEVYIDFETLPRLAEEPLKVIGIYRKNNDLTELNLLVQRENGAMITEEDDPEIFENLRGVANEFLQAFVPDFYLQMVEDGQKELEDARKEVDKKREDLQRNRERIADLKEEILKLENEVNEYEKELVRLENQAERQSEKFDALKKRQKEAMSKLAKLK